MHVRIATILMLGLIVSPTWADTVSLHCSETLYDKTQNKPYDIPRFYIKRLQHTRLG